MNEILRQRFIGWTALAISAAIIALSAHSGVSASRFDKRAQTAEARVTAVESRVETRVLHRLYQPSSSYRREVATASLEFLTTSGRLIQFKRVVNNKVFGWPSPVKKGDVFEVFYDPTHPGHVRFKRYGSLKFFYFWTFFGAVVGFFGGRLVWHPL